MKGPGKKIAVNASPWITLSICGQVHVLKELYNGVYMPAAVREEILAGERKAGVKELQESQWIKIETVSDEDKVGLIHELGRGESEVIILAKEMGIKEVLIDDRIARMHAKVQGFSVIGTLGLLLRAKKRGILSELKPSVKRIVSKGIWISDDIVERILREAGEQ